MEKKRDLNPIQALEEYIKENNGTVADCLIEIHNFCFHEADLNEIDRNRQGSLSTMWKLAQLIKPLDEKFSF